MTFNNSEILFASLVGSGIVKSVPKFQLLENELGKRVLPQYVRELNQQQTNVGSTAYQRFSEIDEQDKPLGKENQFFPFSLSIDNGASWFTLPYEPMLNIEGSNEIVTRNVAKWDEIGSGQLFGSIKERWAPGDFSIQITGMLYGSKINGVVEDSFPKADFIKLNQMLRHSKEVMVSCPPLELLGVNKLTFKTFKYPFSKGENVQAYDVQALSDSSYNLLINDDV